MKVLLKGCKNGHIRRANRLSADDQEVIQRQEVRISLFSKQNYIKVKEKIVRLLNEVDFALTDRRYVGREDDTGYHNFAIDVAKDYISE